MRSWVTQEKLGVKPLSLHMEKSLGRSTRPPGRLPGKAFCHQVPRLSWKHLGVPIEELEEVTGSWEVLGSQLRLFPWDLTLD